MSTPFDALDYTRATIDLFDAPVTSTAEVVRRCVRLAHHRSDWRALTWLELEGHEFGGPKSKDTGLAADLMREAGLDPGSIERYEIVKQFMDRRTFSANSSSENEGKISGHSVEMAESLLSMINSEIDALGPKPSDTRYDEIDRTEARNKHYATREELRTTLAKTRGALYQYLLRAEKELTFTSYHEQFFTQTKTAVDTKLHLLSPDAVERFNGAYSRLRDGDGESLTQAVTSCRRVLHAVADAVCPPQDQPVTGTDGKTRDLTADKYRNRLLWFINETARAAKLRPLLVADAKLVSDRLEAFDSLASKGVHANVSALEAENLAIHVYVLSAEILRLHELSDPE